MDMHAQIVNALSLLFKMFVKKLYIQVHVQYKYVDIKILTRQSSFLFISCFSQNPHFFISFSKKFVESTILIFQNL